MPKRNAQKNRDYQKKYREKFPEKVRARFVRWYEQNREKQLANRRTHSATPEAKAARARAAREWRKANPAEWEAQKFRNHLKVRYKLTVEQYEAMLVEQNGVCAICYRPEQVEGHRLCVDHDHKTGKVRGLLCRRCNTMCGQGDDDPARLLRGAQYLRERLG